MADIISSLEVLVQRIQVLRTQKPLHQRLIVAIAGAPGSGKSTLAAEICQRLNQDMATNAHQASVSGNKNPESAALLNKAVVVPMDGFHLDNAILQQQGQMAVKGAPQTYDIDGFASLVRRLVQPDPVPIYVPVFERSMDLSRNAAQRVDEQHEIVIVEGNYLLLMRPGWQQLAALFHLNIMLSVPLEILQERLIQRWLDHGHDPGQARRRALSNDIPNALIVTQESSEAHLIYKSVRQ